MAQNEANAGYTFYPEFEEAVILYRGVVSIRIGQGQTVDGITYKQGFLYAEYVDGLVQEIGPVSSFADAVQNGMAGAGTPYPTLASWIQHIIDTTQNALDAEGYAVGTHAGVEVVSPDPAFHNNAKYYAEERAKKWAIGNGTDTDPTTTNNARYLASQAAKWATGGTGGTPGDQNNAKWYSQQAAASASSASEDAGTATTKASQASTSATNAATSALSAEAWATGSSGGTASATNNAKYWSQQANAWATTKANDNAKYYSQQAMKWANFGTDGAEPSASNNAKEYAHNAELSNISAENWATGGTGGTASATNNAMYWSGQSSDSAETAEKWATGQTGGTPTAQNNAKAYATQAYGSESNAAGSASAAAASEGNAAQSALNAAGSASNAAESAQKAELWATGATGGTPGAQNNAQYWADEAHNWTNLKQNDNAMYYAQSSLASAGNSAESALQAESWTKGTRAGQPDLERQNASTVNAQNYANEAKLWANFGSEGNTPTAQNNALYHAERALDYKEDAEAWAVGEINGEPVPQYDPNHNNNAKYWSGQAADSATAASTSESNAQGYSAAASGSASAAAGSASNALTSEQTAAQWATGGTSGTPSATNNSLYYASQAAASAASIQSAQISTEYMASFNGTTHPAADDPNWSSTPVPEKGRYFWSKITYLWLDNSTSTSYYVTYVGTDGVGSVNSVNGKSGNVTLDTTAIYLDATIQDPVLLSTKLTELETNVITTAQIDALFEPEEVIT